MDKTTLCSAKRAAARAVVKDDGRSPAPTVWERRCSRGTSGNGGAIPPVPAAGAKAAPRLPLGQQGVGPTFGPAACPAFQQFEKASQRAPRIADGLGKGRPVFAVLPVVIGEDMIEEMRHPQLFVSGPRSAFDVFQVLQRKGAFMTLRSAEELASHEIGNHRAQRAGRRGVVKGFDFLACQRRHEYAEAWRVGQTGVRLEHPSDVGAALEERLAARQLSGQGFQIQGQEVLAYVHYDIPLPDL